MRLVHTLLAALLVGCAANGPISLPSSTVRGATLSLVRSVSSKPTFELKNAGTSAVAYNHWFALGPDPVAYCRTSKGEIRFCSLHVMLTDDDQPYVHESYIQPGEAVKFQAAPSGDEQVGVQLWFEEREEALWLDAWTSNKSLERTRER
jgi:hypothetical protein